MNRQYIQILFLKEVAAVKGSLHLANSLVRKRNILSSEFVHVIVFKAPEVPD